MHYRITEHGDYLRAVIGDAAGTEDFADFYKELQTRCTIRGFNRALVVVLPESAVPGPERLALFDAASRTGIKVRAFLQEMEGISWLLS